MYHWTYYRVLIIFLAKRVAPRRYLEKKKAQKLVRGNVVILVGLAAGAIEVIFEQTHVVKIILVLRLEH